MTKRKTPHEEKERAAKLPQPPPRPKTSILAAAALDRWYLECLKTLTEALGEPPTIDRLASWMNHSSTAIHRRLCNLEYAGFTRRNEQRRFVVTGRVP